MALTRPLLEIVRALCVLALILLNFGHVAVASPLAGDVLSVSADTSFCGDPIEGERHHAPCHACRIGGGAGLPPAVAVVCAPGVVAERVGAIAIVPLRVLPSVGIASPRGPPTA